MSLSSDEIAAYGRDGYVALRRPVFSPGTFARLLNVFEETLAARPPTQRPEHLDKPHLLDARLYEFILAPEVLALIRPLLGEDLALMGCHFICKEGKGGLPAPWHEDSSYWKGMLDPMEAVTVWIALDASTRDNGCMMVIPGTHDHGYSDYRPVDPSAHVFASEIDGPIDTRRARAVELAPNEVSLHAAKLIHGSGPNNSGRRRCGLSLRFIRTQTRVIPPWDERLLLFLASGEGQPGFTYGDTSRTYPEYHQQARFWK